MCGALSWRLVAILTNLKEKRTWSVGKRICRYNKKVGLNYYGKKTNLKISKNRKMPWKQKKKCDSK